MNAEQLIALQDRMEEFTTEIMDVIGDGTCNDDLINILLNSVTDSTLAGQAYEGLHFLYYAASRAKDSITDVLGIEISKVKDNE